MFVSVVARQCRKPLFAVDIVKLCYRFFNPLIVGINGQNDSRKERKKLFYTSIEFELSVNVREKREREGENGVT